ncbi:MAG: 2-hydroxyacyl-CoA dehydratase family protein [Chloroflexota bacterium]|nr:2-hydroxyacyl-CoA dehydratase family protein [Chloroflexota bacterium]
MLKEILHKTKIVSEQTLDQRPSAWAMYNKQLAGTLFSAFDETTKVVWTTSYGFPNELLAGFDVVLFDFEVASAMLPRTQPDAAVAIMSQAEAKGYSVDLCSYHRMTMGHFLQNDLPKADLMLTSSLFCDSHTKVNQILAHYYGKEAIMLDVPNELSAESVTYVSEQLRNIARKLEEVTGQRFNSDRLRACIRYSNQARSLYKRLAELQKEKPYPWNGMRAIQLSLSGGLFSGTHFQAELYEKIIAEIEDRIASGRVRPEKHRILWLVWSPAQPTMIPDVLKGHQTSLVMGELARVYWDEIDESHPYEGMALKCLKNPYVGPIAQRLSGILELVEDYHVDGVVHFSPLACRFANASFRIIQDVLVKRNIPFLVLEGDMLDKRNYSDQRTRESLDSFIEMIDKK